METLMKPKGDVIMVTTPEKAINYKWYKGHEKMHPGLQVISFEDIQKMDSEIFDNESVYPNTIWMKHPFIPNRYIDINTAGEVLICMKLDYLTLIAQNLGVKEFKSTAVFKEIAEATYDTNIGVQYKTINAKTNIQLKEYNNETKIFQREKSYKGDFSPQSYEQAKAYAKEYGLDKDHDVFMMLQSRNPEVKNEMTREYVSIELTRELNKTLDIALTVNAIGVFALDASYSQTISTRKKVSIQTEWIF